MKTLKVFFSLFVFAAVLFSCTPQAIDEDQTNSFDNIHATGDEDGNVDDGSKG